MTANEALLRLGITVLDEVGHWHRDSQTHPVGSTAHVYARGAIEALNRMADHLNVAIQRAAMQEAGLPIPVEEPTFRVIKGGRP